MKDFKNLEKAYKQLEASNKTALQAMEKMHTALILAHSEIDGLRKKVLELLPLEERMKQKNFWKDVS